MASGMPNGVHVFYLDGASPVLVAWNEVTNQIASMRVPFASIDSVSSMTGTAIFPLMIDASYEVDMDTLTDWERGEWVVATKTLDMVWPEEKK